jgi:Aspartyl protease/PDZ domain
MVNLMGPLFLAVAIAAASVAPAEAAPRDVPFQLIDNRVFVPVTVDGHGPFEFLLDTGAPEFTLSQETLTAIGAHVTGTTVGSGVGEKTQTGWKARVGSFRIADWERRDVDIEAYSFKALNEVIGFTHFDGVAGKPLFDRFTADLDFDKSVLHLIEPAAFVAPRGAIVVPFEIYQDFMPMVRGTVGGVTGRLLVDLGDRSSLTLFGPFWRAHRLDKAFGRTLDALTGFGIGGPVRSLVARVPVLSFGAASVHGVVARLSLQKAGAFADPAIAGSIGTGVLKRFRTVIDYAHKRFVLIPDPAMDKPDAYDRSGLWIGRRDARFAIFDVMAGGPGDRAGLRTGDVVTAVDGVKAEALDLFALRAKLRDPAATAPVTFDYLRGGHAGRARLLRAELLPQD